MGFCVQDLRPFRLFEGAGAAEALRRIAPRVRAPSHGVMRGVMLKLGAEHDEKLKERASLLAGPVSYPVAVGEVDMWTSPMGDSYLGFFIHGLTDAMEPAKLLVYSDALKVAHTAQNQAQRLLHATRQKLGVDIGELLWAVQTDNTASAVNIAGFLDVRSLRCVAHILALGPRHQLHPVKRRVDGEVHAPASTAIRRVIFESLGACFRRGHACSGIFPAGCSRPGHDARANGQLGRRVRCGVLLGFFPKGTRKLHKFSLRGSNPRSCALDTPL